MEVGELWKCLAIAGVECFYLRCIGEYKDLGLGWAVTHRCFDTSM